MLWPVHIEGELTVTVGDGVTVTVDVEELKQPFASVPVTV
jgi:hypothetical protein